MQEWCDERSNWFACILHPQDMWTPDDTRNQMWELENVKVIFIYWSFWIKELYNDVFKDHADGPRCYPDLAVKWKKGLGKFHYLNQELDLDNVCLILERQSVWFWFRVPYVTLDTRMLVLSRLYVTLVHNCQTMKMKRTFWVWPGQILVNHSSRRT